MRYHNVDSSNVRSGEKIKNKNKRLTVCIEPVKIDPLVVVYFVLRHNLMLIC